MIDALRSDARAPSAQCPAPSGDSRLERARTAFGDAVILTEPYLGRPPLWIEPRDGRLTQHIEAATGWMVEHRACIEEALLSFGAVLWRGFPVTGPDDFAALMTGFTPFSKGYVAGTSERKAIKGNVMESTRTPSEVYIFLHQEMAYLPYNPRLIAFHCKQPPDEGGRTVIADMRGLLEALPPALQERLVDRGVIYGRNMRNAMLDNDWRADPAYRHHAWQQWFGTDDTAAVSAQLAERGIHHEWDEDRNLRFWTHRPGVIDHIGQRLFFNQIYAQTPHRLCVGEAYPALMDAAYGVTVPRPYFVSLGDGKQLTEEEFFAIHDELERRRVDFDWQAGDVLLLENKLTGHGRTPFHGARDIQVMLFE
jgi:alpha-ketoglutarate-dependent taurine dioxygenase